MLAHVFTYICCTIVILPALGTKYFLKVRKDKVIQSKKMSAMKRTDLVESRGELLSNKSVFLFFFFNLPNTREKEVLPLKNKNP